MGLKSRRFRWRQQWFVKPIGEDSNKAIAELLGGDPTTEIVQIEVNGEMIEVMKCNKSLMPVLHQSKNVFYEGFVQLRQHGRVRRDSYNSRLPVENEVRG